MRQIEKNRTYLVTVNAVTKSFRFVPRPIIVATLWFCFAAIVLKYRKRILMHEFLFMSNHFHLVLTDADECLPNFMRDLNSLLSRALNSTRGTRGTNIEKGYHAEVLLDDEAIIRACVYVLANASAANLVKRSRQWKSVTSAALSYDAPASFDRPTSGLWKGALRHASRDNSVRSGRANYARRWKVPAIAELFLVRPPVRSKLRSKELRSLIWKRLSQRDVAQIKRRRANKTSVLGWTAVISRAFTDIPPSGQEMFGEAPIAAAEDKALVARAVEQRKTFIAKYRAALARFLEGDVDVVFPYGTWRMARLFKVKCHAAPA